MDVKRSKNKYFLLVASKMLSTLTFRADAKSSFAQSVSQLIGKIKKSLQNVDAYIAYTCRWRHASKRNSQNIIHITCTTNHKDRFFLSFV